MFTIITCALYLLCANTKAFLQCNQFYLSIGGQTLLLIDFSIQHLNKICAEYLFRKSYFIRNIEYTDFSGCARKCMK